MWRPLTEDDILQSVSAPERDAIQTAAADPDQPLPIGAVIATAVADARGRLAAHSGNVLEEGMTLPETLVHHVVSIVRWRLLTRLPIDRLATDARKLEYQEALKALADVAAGRYAIEQPVIADTEERVTFSPSISARPPKFGRAQQDGI